MPMWVLTTNKTFSNEKNGIVALYICFRHSAGLSGQQPPGGHEGRGIPRFPEPARADLDVGHAGTAENHR